MFTHREREGESSQRGRFMRLKKEGGAQAPFSPNSRNYTTEAKIRRLTVSEFHSKWNSDSTGRTCRFL